jgi:hypothetical protein
MSNPALEPMHVWGAPMRRLQSRAAAVVATLLFSSAGLALASAQAQALPASAPDLSSSFEMAPDQIVGEILSPGKLTLPNGNYAKLSYTPNPTLEAFATTPDYRVTVTVSQLKYYFAVTGGSMNQAVPINLRYKVIASSTSQNGYASDYIGIFRDSNFLEAGGSIIGTQYLPGMTGVVTDSGVLTGTVFDDQTNYILLTARAQGQSGNFYAQIDPVLSIDPSFSAIDPNYLSDYSIQLNPDIGNLPDGVPESSTWAMMLLGFSGLGAVRRITRSDKVVAA